MCLLVVVSSQQVDLGNAFGSLHNAFGSLGSVPINAARPEASSFGSLDNAFAGPFSNTASALSNAANAPVNTVNVAPPPAVNNPSPVVNPNIARPSSINNPGDSESPISNTGDLFSSLFSNTRPSRFANFGNMFNNRRAEADLDGDDQFLNYYYPANAYRNWWPGFQYPINN